MRPVRVGVVGVLFMGASLAVAGSRAPGLAEPWWLSGDHRDGQYQGSLTLRGDVATGDLRSAQSRLWRDAFGTVARDLDPAALRGRRVRLRARVRSQGVQDWCGLWMRVDGADEDAPLGFDNMEDRALRGTTPWRDVAVVLDVPRPARNLAYGFLLSGAGSMEVQDLVLEVVGPEVPATDPYSPAPSSSSQRRQ